MEKKTIELNLTPTVMPTYDNLVIKLPETVTCQARYHQKTVDCVIHTLEFSANAWRSTEKDNLGAEGKTCSVVAIGTLKYVAESIEAEGKVTVLDELSFTVENHRAINFKIGWGTDIRRTGRTDKVGLTFIPSIGHVTKVVKDRSGADKSVPDDATFSALRSAISNVAIDLLKQYEPFKDYIPTYGSAVDDTLVIDNKANFEEDVFASADDYLTASVEETGTEETSKTEKSKKNSS